MKLIKRIEEERAKKRLEATWAKPGEKIGSKVPVNSPAPRGKGDSRVRAAERLGIGEEKAERGLKVVQVADKLKEAGEEEKTEEQIIREYELIKRIEEERAKKRLEATWAKPGEKVGSKVAANSRQPRGESRSCTRAAQRLGMGENKAERGLKVVQAKSADEPH